MNPRITVIGKRSSQETIAALTDLLDQAHRGDVIGIAAVAVYAQRRYTFKLAGESERSPTFAIGTVIRLQDYILDRMPPPPTG